MQARRWWLLPSLLALVAMPPRVLAAGTCTEHAVSARGEPSRYEFLAKAKARGNWRAKVRAMPELGAEYADWYKALGAEYQCTPGAAGVICLAKAHPCRDG
jgi:hypothetical protein